MELEVRLFAGLHKYVEGTKSGEPFTVHAGENATIADLLKQLGIPEKAAFVTLVNGSASPASTVLKDRDRVGIFPPVGGG
ncbi:MoaD/ThiS family protein [Thermincola potens]|uniref:ThiamineS protein n=1 Tax=Thermincola potens (strain JR) TaxID=635013 RepID=D5X979_THEPJ|nr:MoaD/ThiS family protein [Thermincola potens]ADG82983.1 thiamineS protein [Thermincola potens JR]